MYKKVGKTSGVKIPWFYLWWSYYCFIKVMLKWYCLSFYTKSKEIKLKICSWAESPYYFIYNYLSYLERN